MLWKLKICIILHVSFFYKTHRYKHVPSSKWWQVKILNCTKNKRQECGAILNYVLGIFCNIIAVHLVTPSWTWQNTHHGPFLMKKFTLTNYWHASFGTGGKTNRETEHYWTPPRFASMIISHRPTYIKKVERTEVSVHIFLSLITNQADSQIKKWHWWRYVLTRTIYGRNLN